MADANIELNVTGNASQQLQQVQKNLAGVSATADKVSGSIGGLSGAMARLGGVLAGLQIGSYVANMFEMADAITDLSAATGVGVAEIKSLRDALEANGGSADDVGKMIRTLAKNIYEARDASSEAGKTLKAFGVSQAEIAKGDTTQILLKLIERFATMEDGAAKTALQMKLFGKSMTEVDFTGVNQGLDEMISKNKELEPTLNNMGTVFDNVKKISKDFQANIMKDSGPITSALVSITENTQAIADVLASAVKVVTAFGIAWATTRGAMAAQVAVMSTLNVLFREGLGTLITNTAARMNEAAQTARATTAKVADTAATVANTGATVANTAATVANAGAQAANAAATAAGGAAAAKTMGVMKGLQTILLGPALANTVGFWGRFKAIILAVAGAFGVLQTAQTGAIAGAWKTGMKSTAALTGMAKAVQLAKNAWIGLKQVIFGLFGIVFRVIRIFLRFGNIALLVWAVFDAFNAVVKLITGSSLVEWFDRLIQKMFGFSIVKWAGAQIDWLWGKIKQFVKWLTGVDLSSKTVPKDGPPPPPPPGTNQPPPNVPTGNTGGGGGGGRSQKDINKDLKKSIEDITKSYKDQSVQRLKNLAFEVSILGLSEDQRELETAKKDIIDQQNETLKQLDQQEADIKANSELTAASRKKNLDLVAQQRLAVQAQASEELASTDALIKKKQEYALLQEKLNNELAIQQLAMDNKKALTDLEEQVGLIGLYGDALEDANLKLEVQDELQSKLLDIEKKKLELERNRTQLGEARLAIS